MQECRQRKYAKRCQGRDRLDLEQKVIRSACAWLPAWLRSLPLRMGALDSLEMKRCPHGQEYAAKKAPDAIIAMPRPCMAMYSYVPTRLLCTAVNMEIP